MQEIVMMVAGGVCLLCLVLMITSAVKVGKLNKQAKARAQAQAQEKQEELERLAREQEKEEELERLRKEQEKQANQEQKETDDEYLRKMEELTLRNEEAARRIEEATRQGIVTPVVVTTPAPVVEKAKEEVINPEQVDIKFVKVEFEDEQVEQEIEEVEIEQVQAEEQVAQSPEQSDEFAFVKEKTQAVSVSLAAKIALSSTDVKSYFCEIVNYALSFNKVKRRTSWSAEKIYSGRIPLLTLKMNGKTLGAYFALNPSDYEGSTLPYKDVSDKKSYVETPLFLKIKSALSLKRAKMLIDDVMNNNGFEKGNPVVEITPADYPAADVATLARNGEVAND